MPKSISNLKLGDVVRVGYREWVPDSNSTFLGITGEGGERRAKFKDSDGDEWEAYIFNGRWSIGTSADPAKLYAAL